MVVGKLNKRTKVFEGISVSPFSRATVTVQLRDHICVRLRIAAGEIDVVYRLPIDGVADEPSNEEHFVCVNLEQPEDLAGQEFKRCLQISCIEF